MLATALTICLFICIIQIRSIFKAYKDIDSNISRLVKRFLFITFPFCIVAVCTAIFLITNEGKDYLNTDQAAFENLGMYFHDSLTYASATHPQNTAAGAGWGNVTFHKQKGDSIGITFNSLHVPLLQKLSDGGTELLNKDYAQPVQTILFKQKNENVLAINFTKIESGYVIADVEAGAQRITGVKVSKPEGALFFTIVLDDFVRGLYKTLPVADPLYTARPAFNNSYFVVTGKGGNTRLDFFGGNNFGRDFSVLINGQPAQAFDQNAARNVVVSTKGSEFCFYVNSRSERSRLLFDSLNNDDRLLTYTFPQKYSFLSGNIGQVDSFCVTNNKDSLLQGKDSVYYTTGSMATNTPLAVFAKGAYTIEKGNTGLYCRFGKGQEAVGIAKAKGAQVWQIPSQNMDTGLLIRVSNFASQNGYSFWLHVLLPVLVFWFGTVLLFLPFVTTANNKWYRGLLLKSRGLFTKRGEPLPAAVFNPYTVILLLIMAILFPVRWLLMWRMATFPPLDVDNKNQFDQLTHYFVFSISNRHTIYWDYLIIAASLGLLFWYTRRQLANYKKVVSAYNYPTATIVKLLASALAIAAVIIVSRSALLIRVGTFLIPVAMIFGLMVLFRHTRLSDKKRPRVLYTGILLCVAVGLLLLVKEKAFAIVIIMAVLIWLMQSNFTHKKNTFFNSRLFKPVFSIVLPALIFLSPFYSSSETGFKALNFFDSQKQTLCRIALLGNDRDSLLENNPLFTSSDTILTKLIETSQNQQIINNYKHYGSFWYSPFKGLSIKPTLNYTTNYATQALDLVGLRYIWAEHGAIVLWEIIAILMLPVMLSFVLIKQKRSVAYYKDVLEGSWVFQRDTFFFLVVAVFALFVGFSSSNEFVFMGLDLPIVGFHSLFAMLLPLTCFALAVSCFNAGTDKFEKKKSVATGNFIKSPEWFKIVIFCLFVLVFIGGFLLCNTFWYKNKEGARGFSLDNFKEQLAKSVDIVNERIFNLQHEYFLHNPGITGNQLISLVNAAVSSDSAIAGTQYFTMLKPHMLQALKLNSDSTVFRNDIFVNAGFSMEKDSTSKGRDFYYIKYLVNKNSLNQTLPFEGSDDWNGNLLALDSTGLDTIIVAKKIWDNGTLRHVYPLGSAFPLAYNLVQYNNEAKKHSYENIVLSIDLRLTASLNRKLDSEATGVKIDTYKPLLRFAMLNFNDKLSPLNETGIYWDPAAKILHAENIEGLELLQKDIHEQLFAKETYMQNGIIMEAIADFVYKQCPLLTVSVLNSNGGIVALCYKNASYGFDPNERGRINANFQVNSLMNTNEFDLENGYLIHPCMQKIKGGPGSSIKPIMYNAVFSQFKNFDWGSLEIKNNYEDFCDASDSRYLKSYNALNLRGGNTVKWHVNDGKDGLFSELSTDQHININHSEYLAGSSNLYHSSVMFLGYFSRAGIKGNFNTVLGTPTEKSFPLYVLHNKTYAVNSRWPVFGDTTSFLATGLKQNFGFKWGYETGKAKYDSLYSIFASAPLFNFALSYGMRDTVDFFKKYIQTATSGGDPISVSPLQMAFLTAKLFTQNKGLQLQWGAMPDSGVKTYMPFTFDSLYGEPGYITQLNELLFDPLGNDIFKNNNEIAGTLSELKGFFDHDFDIDMANGFKITYKPVQRTFFLYAKTGTANKKKSPKTGPGGAVGMSDRFLMGCVSANRLGASGSIHTLAELNSNKSFIFYIHQEGRTMEDVDAKAFQKIRAKVIMDIIKSRAFNQYMQ